MLDGADRTSCREYSACGKRVFLTWDEFEANIRRSLCVVYDLQSRSQLRVERALSDSTARLVFAQSGIYLSANIIEQICDGAFSGLWKAVRGIGTIAGGENAEDAAILDRASAEIVAELLSWVLNRYWRYRLPLYVVVGQKSRVAIELMRFRPAADLLRARFSFLQNVGKYRQLFHSASQDAVLTAVRFRSGQGVSLAIPPGQVRVETGVIAKCPNVGRDMRSSIFPAIAAGECMFPCLTSKRMPMLAKRKQRTFSEVADEAIARLPLERAADIVERASRRYRKVDLAHAVILFSGDSTLNRILAKLGGIVNKAAEVTQRILANAQAAAGNLPATFVSDLDIAKGIYETAMAHPKVLGEHCLLAAAFKLLEQGR